MLLEVRVGEAAGLLCAGLGAVVVSAGKALEGAVSAGVPAIRKAVSSVPRPCHAAGGGAGARHGRGLCYCGAAEQQMTRPSCHTPGPASCPMPGRSEVALKGRQPEIHEASPSEPEC